MARIRSQHPGQWTDEHFVSMSPFARLLTLALRNEADDQGIFEWKPVTLKMRLLPADNVDIQALLEELISNEQVTSYEVDGRKYGAIRNFCRFQRPKKPNSVHPITDEIRTYVGMTESDAGTTRTSSAPCSEPVGNQFGTGGENAPQMKEVVSSSNTPPTPPGGVRKRNKADWKSDQTFLRWWEVWKASPKNPNDPGPAAAHAAWLKAIGRGVTAEQMLHGAQSAKQRFADQDTPPDKVPHSQTWLNGDRWSAFEGEDEGVRPEEERPSNLMVRKQRDYPPEVIDRLREIKRIDGMDAADDYARGHLEPVG